MPKLKYTCDECDSEFTLHYHEDYCEDSPSYCPFCGSYMLEDNQDSDSEYSDDD